MECIKYVFQEEHFIKPPPSHDKKLNNKKVVMESWNFLLPPLP